MLRQHEVRAAFSERGARAWTPFSCMRVVGAGNPLVPHRQNLDAHPLGPPVAVHVRDVLGVLVVRPALGEAADPQVHRAVVRRGGRHQVPQQRACSRPRTGRSPLGGVRSPRTSREMPPPCWSPTAWTGSGWLGSCQPSPAVHGIPAILIRTNRALRPTESGWRPSRRASFASARRSS